MVPSYQKKTSKEQHVCFYENWNDEVVFVLSTLHNDDSIDEITGDEFKPEIITFYNLTKGGVDFVDGMEFGRENKLQVASHIIFHNSKCWWNKQPDHIWSQH